MGKHTNPSQSDGRWSGDLSDTRDVTQLGGGRHSSDDVAETDEDLPEPDEDVE
jgi:hypothetical protein